MTNYVVVNDGVDYGQTRGNIGAVVQGEEGKTLIIDVRDLAGNDVPITGATGLSGTMTKTSGATSATTAITGTITVASGGLSWEMSSGDIGTAGRFRLLFQYTLSGDIFITHPAEFVIYNNPAADAVQGAALVGISPAASDWLTAEKTNIEAAADGEILQSDGTNSEGSGILASTVLVDGDIGVTVQGYDADTAKLDVAQSWSAAQNLQDNELTRPKLKDYGETINALGSIGGGTQDIDLTLGNVVSGTVDTSETTFTFSNPPASGTYGGFILHLTNGGSQTVNWPASVDWAGGTAPTLTAAGVDRLSFDTLDGGTTWFGFLAGADIS